MHIRRIEKTELNGMVLQHTQTLPEVSYKGCVICFINFNGDIEGVGTRIVDLSPEEFETFKKLIGKIEFEDRDEPDYAERTRMSIENIMSTAERLLRDFEDSDMIWSNDLEKIRKNLIEIDLINAKLNRD